MTFRSKLVEFIQTTLIPKDRKIRVDEDTPLIEDGLLDSIGLLQVTAFVEEKTGVHIPDTEVSPDNFATVATIDELVNRLEATKNR